MITEKTINNTKEPRISVAPMMDWTDNIFYSFKNNNLNTIIF